MIFIRLSLLFFLALIISTPVNATNYYVRSDGSVSTCSAENLSSNTAGGDAAATSFNLEGLDICLETDVFVGGDIVYLSGTGGDFTVADIPADNTGYYIIVPDNSGGASSSSRLTFQGLPGALPTLEGINSYSGSWTDEDAENAAWVSDSTITAGVARALYDSGLLSYGDGLPSTNLADCRATDGSWYYDSTSDLLYVNPVGTADPNTAAVTYIDSTAQGINVVDSYIKIEDITFSNMKSFGGQNSSLDVYFDTVTFDSYSDQAWETSEWGTTYFKDCTWVGNTFTSATSATKTSSDGDMISIHADDENAVTTVIVDGGSVTNSYGPGSLAGGIIYLHIRGVVHDRVYPQTISVSDNNIALGGMMLTDASYFKASSPTTGKNAVVAGSYLYSPSADIAGKNLGTTSVTVPNHVIYLNDTIYFNSTQYLSTYGADGSGEIVNSIMIYPWTGYRLQSGHTLNIWRSIIYGYAAQVINSGGILNNYSPAAWTGSTNPTITLDTDNKKYSLDVGSPAINSANDASANVNIELLLKTNLANMIGGINLYSWSGTDSSMLQIVSGGVYGYNADVGAIQVNDIVFRHPGIALMQ